MSDAQKRPNCFGNVTEFGWTDAFYSQNPQDFIELFHPNIIQAAGAGDRQLHGAETVAKLAYGWASKLYEYCNFIHEGKTKYRTCIEWELLTHNNMHMEGATLLVKNEEGKIINSINAHRSLMEVTLFGEHFGRGPEGVGTVHATYLDAEKNYGFAPKIERKPDGFVSARGITEEKYSNAFAAGTKEGFMEILAEDAVLSAAYVVDEIKGRDQVAEALARVSQFFERHMFTHEITGENHICLQYEGKLRNCCPVGDGFVILTVNEDGKIAKVADHPMPLSTNLSLSVYVRDNSSLDPKYFYRDTLFAEALEKYGTHRLYGDE